jgi:type VI secretion system secreted protein Hcp
MTLLRSLIKASAVLGALAGLFWLARADALAVTHLTVESAAPIFMKCDALTKGAESAKGTDWIELKSFSFGIENPTTIGSATGGAGAGKTRFHEFTIKKTVDKASPLFFKSSPIGSDKSSPTGPDKCTVNLDRQHTSPNQPYMTLNLENVMISSYSVSGGDRPTESITFNFTKIEYKDNAHPTPPRGNAGGTVLPGGNLQLHPTPTPTPPAKQPIVH